MNPLDSWPRSRRIEQLLIGYGIVGLAVAAFGVIALVLAFGRINGLADRVRDDVGGVSATLERTATVLDDAAATAGGFQTTVASSTTALNQAAGDLREIVPRLRDLETQANQIDVLGSRPLASIAGLFGQIAGQLGNLDGQLDGVATNLAANGTALAANAVSLADLATETRTLADRLGGDSLPAAVEDARWLLMAMLAVATLGAIVPATGALALGIWLRRSRQARTGLIT